MPRSFADIALRPGKRMAVIGRSRSGKTVLADHLIVHAAANIPGVQILVADTKPRFRAERTPMGFSAQRYYRGWKSAPVTPGSVRLDLTGSDPLRPFKRKDCHIGIAQADRRDQKVLIASVIEEFMESSTAKHPRILVIDEMGDFYRQNGSPILASDPITWTQRAGGEKGVGTLLCSQRPRGIGVQSISEADTIALFDMRYSEDMKHLMACGYPPGELPPPRDAPKGTFRFWRDGMPRPVDTRLKLSRNYAKQLSDT